ncbi:hypothetical protein JCGZ_07817 [Jatropha curcas]|uniref:Uncharacterized protein n=1 Tax=Jatropha curcas TaxID=180498 RepID=A0A067KDH3_JATCU|nr:uncharacterized protein LOC119371283 [Jatropha curcas]KDP34246.1 hypothetical protein JCGZ_07817 [Jatropha curcas]
MESLTFLGLIGILREALKIFTKNGKLMSSVALLNLFIQSFLFLANLYSIWTVISDIVFEKYLLHLTSPGTPEFTNIFNHIRKDIKIILEIEIIYVILNSISFLLSATVTILAAAIIHREKEHLSLKELLLRTLKSWTRPLVTWLYVSLFALVYIFIFLAILFLGIKVSDHNPILLAVFGFVLASLASIFYIYLSVTWTLAIVVSVAEQIRGLEALGKAAQLVKGMKRQGFLLNLVFSTFSLIITQGTKLISSSKSLVLAIILALVIINFAVLVRMYWLVAFTVFYFRCKKIHGETVGLEGIVCSDEYSKTPTGSAAPLITDNTIP